jgi:hypothetical protein
MASSGRRCGLQAIEDHARHLGGVDPEVRDGDGFPEHRSGERAHRIEPGDGAPIRPDQPAVAADVEAELERILSHKALDMQIIQEG